MEVNDILGYDRKRPRLVRKSDGLAPWHACAVRFCRTLISTQHRKPLTMHGILVLFGASALPVVTGSGMRTSRLGPRRQSNQDDLQSRFHFAFRQNDHTSAADEAASLLFGSSLLNRHRLIRCSHAS